MIDKSHEKLNRTFRDQQCLRKIKQTNRPPVGLLGGHAALAKASKLFHLSREELPRALDPKESHGRCCMSSYGQSPEILK